MNENLTKARDCAAFAVNDLRAANVGAPAVVSYLLLPLIQRAAALHNEIDHLCSAIEYDSKGEK